MSRIIPILVITSSFLMFCLPLYVQNSSETCHLECLQFVSFFLSVQVSAARVKTLITHTFSTLSWYLYLHSFILCWILPLHLMLSVYPCSCSHCLLSQFVHGALHFPQQLHQALYVDLAAKHHCLGLCWSLTQLVVLIVDSVSAVISMY